MRKIYFTIFIIFYLLPEHYHAQVVFDQLVSHHRYWYYRERLHSYVVNKQNNEAGSNIPASLRGGFDNYGNRVLKWGDATIDLAYYIATLATEWKLLWLNGQSTIDTEERLRNAILAVDRLDFVAETQYYNSGDASLGSGIGSLDGFLVRDDVPDTYITTNPILLNGIGSSAVCPIVNSSMIEGIAAVHSPRAAGVDQIVNLLMAFRLVKECVPSYVTFATSTFAPYNPTESKLLQEVQNITDRIFNRLSSDNWLLYNSILGTNVPSNDGGNFLGYPYPAGIAAICNQINPTQNHTDAITVAENPFWLNLGAGGGSWTSPDCSSISNDNYLLLMLDAGTNSFVGGLACSKAQTDAYEIIPLIKQVLFGTTNCIPINSYNILLRDAPCVGPYNWTNGVSPTPGLTYETDEWSSTQRWVHPERRYSKKTTLCGDPNEQPAEYNGLDYMLLHNLYYLAVGGYNAENLQVFNDISDTYPRASGKGSIADPAILGGYESIYIAGLNVLPGTDVTYHAGYFLDLQANCTIKPSSTGSVFHAYVAPFSCESSLLESDYRQMSDDTSSSIHALVAQLFENNFPQDSHSEETNSYIQSYQQYVSSQTQSSFTKLVDVSIFPNPNSGIFQVILISNQKSNLQFMSICDVLGNEIWRENYDSKALFNIDISAYSKGLYILKIVDSSGQVQTEKIVYK